MRKYNITTVIFLVNSFKYIVDSYGRVNRTVDLYKRQLESMIISKQISINDRDIVFELIGIVNTSNIKWNIADNKVSQFLSAMNLLLDITDDSMRNNMINILIDNKSISDSVANIIKKLYK